MRELTLFADLEIEKSDWKVTNFSAGNLFPSEEREKLENRYWDITEITSKFNRKSVSFQLSKNDRMQRWLKYKEGFSADLVKTLISEFGIKPGQTIMDPFMGSGTTALVACMNGMNSVGFDILPMSKVSIDAKMAVFKYNIEELNQLMDEVISLKVPDDYTKETPYLNITKDGYPLNTSIAIEYYTEHFEESNYSPEVKNLIKLCILNTLDPISYAIKAGQYLKWDPRSPKVVKINEERIKQGKAPIGGGDKGNLPYLKSALIQELDNVISDIKFIQAYKQQSYIGTCNFIENSALLELPKMEANSINGVISSPPYCNRYDYTRTYALELAYLGVDDEGIKKLRQELLSCTVESHTKLDMLKSYYDSLGKIDYYYRVLNVINNNKPLQEINFALKGRNEKGEINNKGVLRMVDGYFTELTFIFAELYRLCVPGSYVGFVNDNVRYAGEVIPVDFLTTYIAESIGFKPIKVYTLMQKKGNSSQQMAKYGKVNLRKSITIWKKE